MRARVADERGADERKMRAPENDRVDRRALVGRKAAGKEVVKIRFAQSAALDSLDDAGAGDVFNALRRGHAHFQRLIAG